jgi:NADP-dependent 3-hydroxy acid dehydrogenase YdfG
MVQLTTIRQCNADFAKEKHEGLVCVFAGATSGIGASTLKSLARILQAPTFYVLGRSIERFAILRAEIEKLNPSCKIVFFEVEFSLLSQVDAMCERITAMEQKVDYLYMSAGMFPLNGPLCTLSLKTLP